MRLLREALRDLRANRGRSLLAALSLFISLAALVAVATLGTVVKDVFVVQYEQIHGRVPVRQSTLEIGDLSGDRLAELLTVCRESLGDMPWTLYREGQAVVALPSTEGDMASGSSVSTLLLAGDLSAVRRLPLLAGQWPDTADIAYPGGLVLNQAAADRFGGLGTSLWLQHNDQSADSRSLPPYRQTVTAVIADGLSEPRLYQSLVTAQALQPSVLENTDLTLLAHDLHGSVAAVEGGITAVADRMGVPADRRVVSDPGNIDGTLSSLDVMRLAFGVVSAVMLVISVIGLLNIGLATLRERIRELSLRRALGATRGRVFGLVMASTLLLSLTTAAVTIAAAWAAVTWLLPRWFDPASALDVPGFPVSAVGYGLAAAVAAGIAGGVIPALASSRVDMVQVLRE